jgi:hypothetical protein
MSIDKVFEAFKEAIVESVNKRDFVAVSTLNKSMSLLNDLVSAEPVIKTEPIFAEPIINESNDFDYGVSHDDVEKFLIGVVQNRTVTSSEATELFYSKFKSHFTSYDYEMNNRDEPRWKTRFWNVAHSLRKREIFMPHSGKFAKKYALKQNVVQEN